MFSPSPMMQQFYELKAKHRDAILFFRLGDFYEMFGDDAILTAQLLDLTLTGRGKDENRVPMCGVPYHASERYLVKLVQKGFKVAIAEQVEEANGKNLTRREVVQIVTPATLLQQGAIQEDQNQYLAVLGAFKKELSLLYIDASTGKCFIKLLDTLEGFSDELNRLAVKEVLIPETMMLELDDKLLKHHYRPHLPDQAQQKICEHFKVADVQVLGLEKHPSSWIALAALLKYISEINVKLLEQIQSVCWQQAKDYVYLPATSVQQLELVESLQKSDQAWTLFKVLNHTQTAMGSRRLRQLCLQPYVDKTLIEKRLAAVQVLLDQFSLRQEMTQCLADISDIERLSSRLLGLGRNPRDLQVLARSIQAIVKMATIISQEKNPFFQELHSAIQKDCGSNEAFKNFLENIEKAIVEDAPTQALKPGIIQESFSQPLDELRKSFAEVKRYVAKLEENERDATGIKTLKLGYNKVFGYYLEVSKGQSEAVPSHYIRKQTLTNAERYITPELKEKESILLSAEQQELQQEHAIYDDLILHLRSHIPVIQSLAAQCAELDVLLNFATIALQRKYCRPEFVEDQKYLALEKARHPILDQSSDSQLVPNDIQMDEHNALQLITGPNMAGKSTVMRQVALIVVMAQMGSFVPAERASFAIVDAVFTRIGAFDHLAKGQSTFMVEMLETAAILKQATSESLIVLDEIGRGTSTYDGLSIAAAVAKDLHDRIKARTFFATHYHELADLIESFEKAQNMTMAIEEENGKLFFKYLLVCGKAIQSYGVQVAHMAGLPAAVIQNATDFLEKFEADAAPKPKRDAQQLALF